MDVTVEGLEDAVLPEAIGVKEATLRMLRDVTKMQRWQAVSGGWQPSDGQEPGTRHPTVPACGAASGASTIRLVEF